MLPQRHTSWSALRVPVLLIALTAGVVPARAQRVPVMWNLPAEPGYVSLSGALAIGFSPYPKGRPAWPADPMAMVPAESQIPGLCRQLLDEMWRGSATFRRQWTRLAAARVRITIVLDHPQLSVLPRARAQLWRTPDLRVQIWLSLVDRSAVEHLAHEIEHVLEALDDVDLPRAVAQGLHGATGLGRPPVFETSRARAMGRLVASEVTASGARR